MRLKHVLTALLIACAASFAAADKIIVVSTPAPFDIMTSRRTATLVAELCPGKTAALLFNMVHANTILGRELVVVAPV